MKKISLVIILLVLFCSQFYLAYSQTATSMPQKSQAKTLDMDRDGDVDVVYHSDGKYVSKIEADTNNDNKPDVTVNYKDGKFNSAEVDTDHDGKVDRKFNSNVEFNKWVNDTHPRYADKLQKDNVRFVDLNF